MLFRRNRFECDFTRNGLEFYKLKGLKRNHTLHIAGFTDEELDQISNDIGDGIVQKVGFKYFGGCKYIPDTSNITIDIEKTIRIV